MKIKALVIAAVLSAGIGCKYKPATVTPPPPPAPAVTQPAVAPEDQPPSPNSMTQSAPSTVTAPKAAVAVPAPLLPNQYPNQPPRVGQVVQYCKSVCTINWSGSMFGGPRNPANICMVTGNTADGAATIVAHINSSHPDGIRMDTQLAPDGVSRCIYEAPQCTVSNGCLTAAEKKLCPSCR